MTITAQSLWEQTIRAREIQAGQMDVKLANTVDEVLDICKREAKDGNSWTGFRAHPPIADRLAAKLEELGFTVVLDPPHLKISWAPDY